MFIPQVSWDFSLFSLPLFISLSLFFPFHNTLSLSFSLSLTLSFSIFPSISLFLSLSLSFSLSLSLSLSLSFSFSFSLSLSLYSLSHLGVDAEKIDLIFVKKFDTTVSEKIFGAPKIRNNVWYTIELLYCDSNIVLFSFVANYSNIVPH